MTTRRGTTSPFFFQYRMGWLIWFSIVAGLVAAIVGMIRAPKTGSGAASLTAMHDLQPRDKQEALASIIEARSEHRQWSDRSGETKEGHEG